MHNDKVRAANLALKFFLELAAFASLAVWGWHFGDRILHVGLAVIAPAVAIAVWGLWCAPRAKTRLPMRARIPLELGILVLSALGLMASGHPTLGLVFLAAIAVNTVGLTVLHQWEA